MKNIIDAILTFISLKIISPIKWTFVKYFFTGRAYDLDAVDRERARDLMANNVLLWVSRRETHLTTYLISFGDFLLSLKVWIKNGCKGKKPRWGFWSHAFFNYDNNEIVEAVAKGVQRHYFDNAFDCDAVAALVPRYLSTSEWNKLQPLIAEEMLKQLGKKYDGVFDISNDDRVSCIELVRVILKNKVYNYDLKFSNFESMIKEYKNVTPQMLYESDDFRIVWEVRKK